MKIYHYHPITKEFLFSSDAVLDPIDEAPLIPAFATVSVPSKNIGANKSLVWDGSKWNIIDDYRGQVFYDDSGNIHNIDKIGVAPDPLWTQSKPFIFSDALSHAIQRIKSSRDNAIIQPVTSNALGTPHTYSVELQNRGFLNDLITLGNGGKFTCTDANGIKKRRFHTHQQFLLLASDIETIISSHFDHYETKITELNALPQSATQADFDAVTW